MWPVFDTLLIPAMKQPQALIASCSPGLAGYLSWEVSVHELLTLVKKKSGVTVPELLLHAPSFIQGVVLQLGAEEEPAVNLYILPH